MNLAQERLPDRLPSSEGVEPDGLGVQLDLSSDETVRPGGVHGEGVAQQSGCTLLVGPPQEEDAALGASLQVSRGGTNTGTTPRLKHIRVTRPRVSGC